ncbi:NAD-dependent epimerase/dehydratase [Exiguobacterium sibiricum 255-15]|uniref:NAD-dependent epimerase/dehydratase n=1 Tax=Exiguobacterium sibiricum (strain DSM 17290 / CCUG 55495 / CIP 109462 / JCM 13490 / 255-15) TaxID=262543 RepID=B1YMM0_EXIS2|nr:NAD-dependent epimerase/dehydratase family protein [Exiguobacterium sibiricum]ACB62080.1 NAD-dependent epimerase/dehydratase [Exiguobacterium sibiricum 255-15]
MKKKIIITGKNGYISVKLKEWLIKSGEYEVSSISLRNEDWIKDDFTKVSCLIHTAGIVHQSSEKGKYYEINRDLTIKLAEKCKKEGVKQFIFFSTMSVFGKKSGVINEKTVPYPVNHYGKSKYEAENYLSAMDTDNFKVIIIRPPMVYGPDCPGNYKKLSYIAKKSPIIPIIRNNRSMIFIDNLNNFIEILISKNEQGIFHPQNNSYVCTSDLMKYLRVSEKKRSILLNLNLFKKFITIINFTQKIFGDLVYEKSFSSYSSNYEVVSFYKSIDLSEEVKNVDAEN